MVSKPFVWARIAALVLAASLVAAACVREDTTQQAGPTAGATVKPPTEPTTITFASWLANNPAMKQFAKEFQEEYPTITVEFQTVPFEQATQKLLTQVAGGTAPDVAFMDMAAVADFATRNALLDLTSYVNQSPHVDPNDYVEAWKQGSVLDGKWYGLPFDGETTGLFYRTDLFQEAGLTEPPATWDELESYAAQLTDESKNQYGFILFAPESAYYWYPFLWGAGGNLYNNETDQVEFNSEAGKQAADFYVGLRQYSPPDFYNSNSWDGRVAFAEGKVAMYMAGSWFAGEMQTSFPKIDGKWDSAPLPEGPAGCATTIAGDTLVVFNQTDSPEAAWLWVEFLSRPENLLRWNVTEEGSTLLPPVRSLLEDPEIFEVKPILKGFAENMECGVTSDIQTNKWSQIEAALNEQLGAAIYGDVSPSEALDNAAAKAEEILSK
jgi:multiple sugar transport system substrate-binding protein